MLAEARQAGDGSFLLEQHFRYTYATPVRRLRHRLVVVPRATHGGQRRLDHGLAAVGSPAQVTVTSDGFANHVVDVQAPAVAEWIEFQAWAVIGRRAGAGVTTVAPQRLADRRLLAATPLTSADSLLRDVAREVSEGAVGLDLAERACTWAHRALAYRHGITSVRTTAAEAVALGRGVCQDNAHVMVALCRAAGLPARYVSGHLVGEGGSHAWVEVVVRDPTPAIPGRTVAVAFDPTHDRRAGSAYLTVAVGRDYTDVAPTSGTFDGTGPGVLSAGKRLRVVEAEGPPPAGAARLTAAS